jgi:hypothetical protein
VLTFNGKGVPMRHADLRTAMQAAATRRQRRLGTRLSIIDELGSPDTPRPLLPHPKGNAPGPA